MSINRPYLAAAAGAVLATGALATSSAFAAPGFLNDQLDLTDEQTTALQEAHELRHNGDIEGAQQVLDDAGIDMSEIRGAMDANREAMHERHEAIKAAIEANDYSAFVTAAADTPFAENITSEADFARLVEAHGLMEEARTIMEELGFEGPGMMGGRGHKGFGPGFGPEAGDTEE